MFNTICVVGLGYIGLPTAAMLASRGCRVVGLEVSEHVINAVNSGRTHIVEPDLDAVVHEAVAAGKLVATNKAPEADAYVIAVPTPFKEEHQPDLRYVEQAARMIASRLRAGNLIVLESTSPVGTTELLAEWFAQERPDLRFPVTGGGGETDVHIAYCPERVLPGQVMRELITNDRIIGGLTPTCAARATDLYRIFVKGDCVVTNARAAEMCKLSENSFRDVNIAFANELSVICDQLGIDVWELIRLANRHPRVNILQPGAGVGGHCIAVDPWFIVASSPNDARLIRTARDVNDDKSDWVVAKIAQALDEDASLQAACFGLAFKPNIDDLRESPAVRIATVLAERFPGRVLAVEPHIDALPPKLAGLGVELVSAETALARADVLALLVDHRAFGTLRSRVAGKRVVDTRGQWSGASDLAVAPNI